MYKLPRLSAKFPNPVGTVDPVSMVTDIRSWVCTSLALLWLL